MERREGSGKSSQLTSYEVDKYIRTPIRNKNRSHKPIHYTDLIHTIHEKTGKQISLRTVQRIGAEILGARQKRTKKRTRDESNHTQHINIEYDCMHIE